MEFINGEDRILYLRINGAYMPIGCLTENSFDESAEMLDTTTRDNGGWSTSRPVMQQYSISFSGIQLNSTVVGGNFTVASYDKLKKLKRDKIQLEWKLQGTLYPVVDYGFCYINSLSEGNVVNEFMTFTGSLTGYGKPLITSLGTTLLNNGNPNTIIATDTSGTELLRTSKF